MKIEINDLNNWTTYTAEKIEDCKDNIDKEVFKLVKMFGDTITMGKVIGREVN